MGFEGVKIIKACFRDVCLYTYQSEKKHTWARPGFEPGTSRTQSGIIPLDQRATVTLNLYTYRNPGYANSIKRSRIILSGCTGLKFEILGWVNRLLFLITKTCLYNFDPLKPHFYIVKLGFTGVYIIFLISAQKIDCGYPLEPPLLWAEIWKISEFFIWKISFFVVKFSVHLNRRVFLMLSAVRVYFTSLSRTI